MTEPEYTISVGCGWVSAADVLNSHDRESAIHIARERAGDARAAREEAEFADEWQSRFEAADQFGQLPTLADVFSVNERRARSADYSAEREEIAGTAEREDPKPTPPLSTAWIAEFGKRPSVKERVAAGWRKLAEVKGRREAEQRDRRRDGWRLRRKVLGR